MNSLVSILLTLAILGSGHQASADIIDKLISKFNGAPSSSSLGERVEFKKFAVHGNKVDDDLFAISTQEIIKRAGFLSDTHQVVTSDGYITELINIINPLATKEKLKRPPVLLFHGALVDSSSWISASILEHHPEIYPRDLEQDGPITSSNRSLAFMLANNGYDVWLVGTRGSNRQNIGHLHYKTELLEDLLQVSADHELDEQRAIKLMETLKFMDFSQDQLVEIEYPKQIDEVLRLTQQKKVSVITYSKATQIMFKLLASDPVHAKRIHSHVAIAPILNNVGTSNFWKMLTPIAVEIPNPVGNLVFSQIMLSSWTRRILASLDPKTLLHYSLTLIAGSSPRYQTSSEPSMIGHSMMSISFTESKHYLQQVMAGKLQRYDHGREKNREVYGGSETPPQYNITNIKVKRWMMVSADQDTLGTPDSALEYFNLQRYKPDKWVKLAKANHIDLVFALDNDVTVNLPILKFMNKFRL